ncbi:RNA polymerase sigma factor [Streptomyces antibioticus]
MHDAFALAAQYWTGIADPPAWLFTVAQRRVDRAARMALKSSTDSDEIADMPWLWSSVTPTVSVQDDFYARQIVGAIGRLPSRQRAATYLRHVHGWSLAEIADLLACAPATAAVHVYRGTAKVRDKIFFEMDTCRYFVGPTPEEVVAKGTRQLEADDYKASLRSTSVRLVRGLLYRLTLSSMAWLTLPWLVAQWLILMLGLSSAALLCHWLYAVAEDAGWRIMARLMLRKRSVLSSP